MDFFYKLIILFLDKREFEVDERVRRCRISSPFFFLLLNKKRIEFSRTCACARECHRIRINSDDTLRVKQKTKTIFHDTRVPYRLFLHFRSRYSIPSNRSVHLQPNLSSVPVRGNAVGKHQNFYISNIYSRAVCGPMKGRTLSARTGHSSERTSKYCASSRARDRTTPSA